MNKSTNINGLTQQQLINEYFLEYRSKILDVAAYLDRLDRATEKNAEDDFRYQGLVKSVEILNSNEKNKAVAMQMILSDPNTELLEDRDQINADGASSRS